MTTRTMGRPGQQHARYSREDGVIRSYAARTSADSAADPVPAAFLWAKFGFILR